MNDVAVEKIFWMTFDLYADRLARRRDGFQAIFSRMDEYVCPTIVETGCLRELGSWEGDGQSTFLFDLFAWTHGGETISIDLDPKSLESAARVCRRATRFVQGDGATEVNRLVRNGLERIDLLYLDSFDHGRDVSIVPAPVHYALELVAAWPALRRGSVIAIDDFCSSETPGVFPGSKGLAVDMFMSKVGAEVIYDGYQKAWMVR